MTLRKDINSIELKLDNLEKTTIYQKDMIQMLQTTIDTQRMLIESCISRILQLEELYKRSPPTNNMNQQDIQEKKEPDDIKDTKIETLNPYIINRKVIV